MKQRNSIIILLLIVSSIAFLSGIFFLQSGLLRNIYDVFFAIRVWDRNDVYDFDHLNPTPPDTILFAFSKKKTNEIIRSRSEVVNSPKNLLTYKFTWDKTKDWYKGYAYFKDEKLDLKIKFNGLYNDHFRQSDNWSWRVKMKDDSYLYSYKKFNILVPYSRAYFLDRYYNSIYKKEGGLIIDSRPIVTKQRDNYNLQIFEPYFSKEIIEMQERRENFILSKELELVFPGSLEDLSESQVKQLTYLTRRIKDGEFFELVDLKQYAFLISSAINLGGNDHHLLDLNLFFYVNPITGELNPFLRELDIVDGTNKRSYSFSELKLKIYDKFLNSGISTKKFEQLDYWVNYYSVLLNQIDVNEVISDDPNLLSQYHYLSKIYPWIFLYKKNLRVPLDFSSIKQIEKPYQAGNVYKFNDQIILKDSILTFGVKDTVILSPGLKLNLQNSSIVFSGKVNGYGDFKNIIEITGDSVSSIIFQDANVNLENVKFKGFGNIGFDGKRILTSAVTFYRSELLLSKCYFGFNHSGDDALNIVNSEFKIIDLNISNSLYDGLDIDFSKGSLEQFEISNSGNDGLDIGGSEVSINSGLIKGAMDKGVSIGEKSIVDLKELIFDKNEIGIALKDQSQLIMERIIMKNNHLDFAGYGKKTRYGPSRISKTDNSFENFSYLIEPSFQVPSNLKIQFTDSIINRMYGAEYGRKSVR